MSEKTYRIGEAAELLNLKTHVLRFWETEFPQLDPLRTDKGQRLYTETHLALLRRIQQLLHEQGMTIEGARRVLEGIESPCCEHATEEDEAKIDALQTEYQSLDENYEAMLLGYVKSHPEEFPA